MGFFGEFVAFKKFEYQVTALFICMRKAGKKKLFGSI